MLKKSLSRLGWGTAEIGLGISEFWPMGVKHSEWKAMHRLGELASRFSGRVLIFGGKAGRSL